VFAEHKATSLSWDDQNGGLVKGTILCWTCYSLRLVLYGLSKVLTAHK
jgi:hypothetical protein